jgi:hypothetical protein
MGDRTTRFSVAVLLTIMDVVVFEHFFGVICEAWAGLAWMRVVLIPTLALWTGSAAVLWLHVYYDLRQILYERRFAQTLNPAAVPTEPREGGDV